MGDVIRQAMQGQVQQPEPTPRPSTSIAPPARTPKPAWNPLTGKRDAPPGYALFVGGQARPAMVQPSDALMPLLNTPINALEEFSQPSANIPLEVLMDWLGLSRTTYNKWAESLPARGAKNAVR